MILIESKGAELSLNSLKNDMFYSSHDNSCKVYRNPAADPTMSSVIIKSIQTIDVEPWPDTRL